MEPTLTKIRAHSQRQAMDWSLVLASQGIETIIAHSQEGEGWGLVVAAGDYENARSAIRQYRLENRGLPWQQKVSRAGLLFDWGSLAWALMLIVFFWLDTRRDLRPSGLMIGSAVNHGEWWRLFTAIWLHADLAHLAANATIGLVLLGLAMGRYGTGAGLLAAYLTGAGGNIADWLNTTARAHAGDVAVGSLGASGMVMGCLGLLAVQSLSLWRLTPRASKYIVGGILGGVMLFVLLGLTPGTNIVAHLGGFISGLLLGGLLLLIPDFSTKPTVNLACGLIFALLVIVPWWLALKAL
jgi:membrane associated rhomboid family serine protease